MKAAGTFRGKTILFVEDDPLLAGDTVDHLQSMGWKKVLFATDLCQADVLKRTAHIDVALLDVNVGAVTSMDLATELAEDGTRIVFTSGYSREELGDRLGEFAFLPKPYTFGQLSVALEAILAEHPAGLAAE